MSASLVKRGLELFNDDLIEEQEESKVKKKKKNKTPMSMISTNRRGVKKELRKLRQKQKQQQMSKRQKPKTAYDEEHKYKERDNTDSNVAFLSRLSQIESTNNETAAKIIEHNTGKLAKNRVPKKTPEKDNSTVFTDKDFEKFEKQYSWKSS